MDKIVERLKLFLKTTAIALMLCSKIESLLSIEREILQATIELKLIKRLKFDLISRSIQPSE